ncbi:serine hydrolase [Mucilaginibacter aquaedulcis]|uniref:serine hydrolase n=1 Tax=Mucilaginibacter aquaedulcis TaxID=1187081 RepID=UPI0025B47DC0|nr:serine hydrolase [Mucilaginibacter aquaedulcis]MDN3550129.1 serine hydrolase [Mucilaginibacter aquaedulcis]
MKTLIQLIIVPILLLVQQTAFAQSDTKNKIQQVETNLVGSIQVAGEKPASIQERMAFYKVNGLSIAVIQNYHIAWAKGYGLANDSLKIPVTTNTLFQSGSISKSLNAVGVLKLMQDKKLDLYSDINTYLNSWKFPYDSLSKGKKITVANLLSHTGGLTVHGFEGYNKNKPLPTIPQILDGSPPANSAAVRSMYAPGLRSEYSGGGVTISQMVVMDITHEPYADYMKREVLQPLGMVNSTYAQPPVGIEPKMLATAYYANGKQVPGKYQIHPEQAAAGLWTTPTDLAKYIIETQLAYEGKSAKVLNQATTKLRLTPYLDKTAALGVFVDELDGTKYFQHGGANVGFRNQYYGSLEGGNGVVVMVNSDRDDIIKEVINSVAKVYGFKGLYRSNIKTLVVVPEAVLQTYVGKYAITPTVTVTITYEDGKLMGQPTGQPKLSLYPESQTKFFLKEVPVQVEFSKNTEGKVDKVILNENGHKNEAKKIQ